VKKGVLVSESRNDVVSDGESTTEPESADDSGDEELADADSHAMLIDPVCGPDVSTVNNKVSAAVEDAAEYRPGLTIMGYRAPPSDGNSTDISDSESETEPVPALPLPIPAPRPKPVPKVSELSCVE
jgi:hypothetical protein